MLSTFETSTAAPTTITDLDRLTKRHAEYESALSASLTDLRDALDQVQRKFLPLIKRQAAAYAGSESDLRAAVDHGRQLFTDRKTIILNGIKVGLRSNAGSLVADDEETTVRLIEKFFPDLVEALIAEVRTPKISAIKSTVPEVDWKKIGCHLEGAGEAVVANSVDSEVEKAIASMVKKLVAGMIETED